VSIFYVNLCFYFNCVVDPNLQIDPSIQRKCILSMLTKCQNMMSFSGFVRSTRRRKFGKITFRLTSSFRTSSREKKQGCS